MLELRAYQTAAIDAVFDHWASDASEDSAIVDLATGTGKSLVIAKISRLLVETYADFRIVIATHVKELIEQNYRELLGIWPLAPAGINSAGLGQRQTRKQITFAGIQSSHRDAAKFGAVDLLIVDEAHLISPKSGTMYDKFIAELRAINPEMRVLKLTATPFRLGTGIIPGTPVYQYGIADGVRDGFLSRLVSKATETGFDLSGVGKSGGEYIEKQLQAAVDKAETTRRAIDEAVAYGRDRRSWLAFCSGVEHALHVRDEIRSRGFTCETVTGTTPSDERRQILEDFKAGRVRCVTNNSVLTTGFNAPGVDMIMALRPTASASLYVQMMGRGTRCAPGKDNCLVLDFAGLIRTHGPVDAVVPKKPGVKGGEAPVKECPKCHSLLHASLMICPDCGHVFEASTETKLTVKASSLAIMQTAPAEWIRVTDRTFDVHQKPGKPDSIVTKFRCGLVVHKTWYCPGHEGRARKNADKFWRDHGGSLPFPRTALEWWGRAMSDELQPTSEIAVQPDGKYIAVVDARPA